MKWTFEQVIQATGAQPLKVVESEFTGVATDSRPTLSGELFVALKGERFDAHDFLDQAYLHGAKGLLVQHVSPETKQLAENITVFVVPDTLKAFHALAKSYHRRTGFKIVGITGSNGKTTCKEFTRTLLQPSFRVHASHGSFNNHFGVPMTILQTPPETEILVQEMGMNHSGEIADLVKIAEPEIVLVTMVGRAHIGELGSQKAVAEAKEEIYIGAPEAVGIFNLDNQFTIAMHERSLQKKRPRNLTFSAYNEKTDVHLRAHRVFVDRLEIAGRIGQTQGTATVPVVGRQNLPNVMAAACVGLALGIPEAKIWEQIPQMHTIWGRGQLIAHPVGAQIVFDGYNANPDSTAALLRTMMEIEVSGRKIAILGEMLELGEFSEMAHQEIGEITGGTIFNAVWFIGPSSAEIEKGLKKARFSGEFFHSEQVDPQMAAYFNQRIQAGDVVVIKGSRGMHLEKVLECWKIPAPKP